MIVVHFLDISSCLSQKFQKHVLLLTDLKEKRTKNLRTTWNLLKNIVSY